MVTKVTDNSESVEFDKFGKYLSDVTRMLDDFKIKVDNVLKEERNVINSLLNCAAMLRVSTSVFKADPKGSDPSASNPSSKVSSTKLNNRCPLTGLGYLAEDSSDDDDNDSIDEELGSDTGAQLEPQSQMQYMSSPSRYVSHDLAAMLIDVDWSTDDEQEPGPSRVTDQQVIDWSLRRDRR
ncbi:unnamed protein product [Soboliphyme baturini]|uniref:WASH-7_N domain-containing protein n=1 Tax=Soboliphyme baturini TaxID=241478 RepID=A0A183I9I5_9BILA|nr:unnamed protein product [Soboliphyme baturini]